MYTLPKKEVVCLSGWLRTNPPFILLDNVTLDSNIWEKEKSRIEHPKSGRGEVASVQVEISPAFTQFLAVNTFSSTILPFFQKFFSLTDIKWCGGGIRTLIYQ